MTSLRKRASCQGRSLVPHCVQRKPGLRSSKIWTPTGLENHLIDHGHVGCDVLRPSGFKTTDALSFGQTPRDSNVETEPPQPVERD